MLIINMLNDYRYSVINNGSYYYKILFPSLHKKQNKKTLQQLLPKKRRIELIKFLFLFKF